MSTNALSRQTLTDTQLKANREAIHSFIAQKTASAGRGSVILLPEFAEDDNGVWAPVAGTGVRISNLSGKDTAFLRFGKMTLTADGKKSYLYTNHFGDGEQDLLDTLMYVDPNATVGSAVKGMRLVVHEQLTPFSRTNPERDIKWANQEEKLACMKLDTTTGELVYIYRRVKAFFADDEGNYPDYAVNKLIEHDNKEQLSLAFTKKLDAQKAIEAQKQARIATLQAKATKTAKEKEELAALLA